MEMSSITILVEWATMSLSGWIVVISGTITASGRTCGSCLYILLRSEMCRDAQGLRCGSQDSLADS